MITSITVKNLRVFSEVPWVFELPGMTVLCGTNSAGKSTLLKVPLLLRQSQMSDSPTHSDQGRLRFVGPQVDLGSFEALVTDNELKSVLGLGIRVRGAMSSDAVDWLESMSSGRPSTLRRQSKNPHEETFELDSYFEFGANKSSENSAPGDGDHQLLKAGYRLIARSKTVLQWSVELDENTQSDSEYRMLLPGDFYRAEMTGFGAMSIAQLEPELVVDASVVPVATSLSGLLPDAILARIEVPGFVGETRKLPLPTEISRPFDELRRSLEGVHYLGPLRTPAERFYIAAEDSAPVFDPSGDFVPYVLRDRAEEEVKVVLPGSSEPEVLSLTKAVGQWLHYLRTGDEAKEGSQPELVVKATRGVLVELSLQTSSGGNPHPLADSGFGYSQVLPILIRGLLARQGETVIVEQPELHLHPALQVRISMFLVALAKSGRQVIVETHSEHVVNAMRVCAAEDSSGEIASLSRIIYVDGTKSPPLLHQLSITEDGMVPDWPKEFFGEALGLSGRLLRAQRD